MKYSMVRMFLVVLIVVGVFYGASANTAQDNSISNVGSKTIYVAKSGTDRNDGLTPEKPKRNIVNAVRAAASGDTIKVSPGTYKENFQIDKNITLTGTAQNNTIIDGQQENSCICIRPGNTVTIINFTITNGKSSSCIGLDTYNGGGGIYNFGTLNLKDSTIANNKAGNYGGGIYTKGPLFLSGVTVKNNTASHAGGGIDSCHLLNAENSTIEDNYAGWAGGGIYTLKGTVFLSGVTVKNNTASQLGGGILSCSLLTVEDSIIEGNHGEAGGGINVSGLLYVYGTTIMHNVAKAGGGIYNYKEAYIDAASRIVDNTPNNFEGKPYKPA